MNIEALIPRWIRKDEGEWPMPDDVIVPPQVATLPRPRTDDEKLLAAVAAVRENDRIEMERLQLELGLALKDLHAEKCKSGLLELDMAQHVNTIATLQTELNDKNGFLNTLKDINAKETAAFARLDIKGTAKKDRAPRPKKKAERESADPTAKADG